MHILHYRFKPYSGFLSDVLYEKCVCYEGVKSCPKHELVEDMISLMGLGRYVCLTGVAFINLLPVAYVGK